MKVKNVIFDLDGTLLDTSEGIINGVRYAEKNMNLKPLSEDVIRLFIGPPLKDSFKRHYCLGETDSDLAVKIFREYYQKFGLYEAKPYAGILNVLKELKENFKIGIATNKREDFAKEMMEYFGMSMYFDCIGGTDSSNILKKEDVLCACMEKLGAFNYDTILIGDTCNDELAAKKIGIYFLGVTYGFGFSQKYSEEYLPEPKYANSTKEILQIVMKKF